MSETTIPVVPAFDRAKSLFHLLDPEPATDEAWNLYTINRLGAPNLQSFLTDSEDEDEERFVPTREFYYTIGRAITALENKMNLQDEILWKSHRVLRCDAHYGGIDSNPDFYEGAPLEIVEPEILSVITRIYSPSRPLYIDVCLEYSWVFGEDDAGFNYFMAFKIHTSPDKDDYRSTDIWKMRKKAIETGSTVDGWHVLAYGYTPPEGKPSNTFLLSSASVKDICDALWGTHEDLPENADEDRKKKRYQELVNSVSILFAAVGIQCNIASSDDDKDLFSYWMLGRIRNWIAREVRNVCGFQLQRDRGPVSQDAGFPMTIEQGSSNGVRDYGDYDEDGYAYDDEDYMY